MSNLQPHRWRMASVRAFAALFTGGVLALALSVATAPPASAHAAFVASQPEPGADLASAPGVVTLRFSEPLIDDLSSVSVTDPAGQTFTGGPTGEREIEVDVNSSAQGQYTVEWKTVSPIDGHTLRGSFTFGVGAEVGHQDEPSDAPTGTDLLIGAARALEYSGLLGAIGLLTLAALAGGAELAWAPQGLHRWMVAAAAGGVLTVAGELLLASSGSLGSAARSFLLAPSGLPRLGRVLTELAAVAITLRATRRSSDGTVQPRSARVWATLLALASLTLIAASGHAAAAGGYGIAADAGHLWTAGVWAGSLMVMALHRPPDGWRGETGRALIREFSPIALTMFAATFILGSVRGWQELATFSDLWTTAYGRVLTAKIALVAAMVPLSWMAWRRRSAHPRTEGLLALGAVLAAGVLAAFPVPPGRAGDDVPDEARAAQGLPRSGDLTLAGDAGDTVLGLSVRPGQPGINDLYVHLVPPGGADEATDLDVTLSVDGNAPVTMDPCGGPCRTATATLDGTDELSFDVSGSDGGQARITLPELPTPDGSDLAKELTERMQQVPTLRYDEVFGPVEPPITSTWEIVAPDRIHGIIAGGTDFRETIRIADRRWHRDTPDGPWEGGEPGGPVVKANRFIWDYPDKTAARIVGTDTVDGLDTRIVSFFVNVGDSMPIWYRLWVDDDDRVRRAEMRAQGHFMDHHYYDLGAPIEIRPPGDAP